MNTPTLPISDPRTEDVRAYIGAVRAWLDDLPQEDVDDLTFGMEADLAERAAEGQLRLGDLLGEPEAYAAELRSAAGLAPRTATVEGASSPGGFAALGGAVSDAGARALERWPWLRDLRPVWWLARGGALAMVVIVLLGLGAFVWVLVPIAAGLSFWVGRRSVARPATDGTGWLGWSVNAVAVVAVGYSLLVAAVSLPGGGGGTAVEEYVPPGLVLDGGMVGNLYVYDAQGNRVEGARVFTGTGRGVFVDPTIVDSGPDGLPYRPDGSVDVATDVFPLQLGDRDPWAGAPDGWTPPLALPPLPGAPAPTPSDAASPSPGTSPSPSPSPSPSASATSVPSPTVTPTPTG